MGGIVGFIDDSMNEIDINRAMDSIQHRGPDGRGTFYSAETGMGLGHVRLSIMDPAGPEQPLYAKGGELVLVCNGELYGFEPIRNDLIRRGHCFYTKNDAEVILHLYLEYGDNFLEYLRGEFSFLLYNKIDNILLAVRDHLGVKPLFYSDINDRFLFASEAKAIFATGKVTPRINVSAVKSLLEGVEQETIFDHVQTVPPGHILRVDLNTRRKLLKQYWRPPTAVDAPINPSVDEYVDDIRCTFVEAVRTRLRSDVGIGAYLSDNASSSYMANAIAKYRRARLKAFHVFYPEDTGFDTIEEAKKIATDVDANFHSIACDHHALLSKLEDCLWATEQPLTSLQTVGEYLLSRFTSKHAKAVMSTEGGGRDFQRYFTCCDSVNSEIERRTKPTERRNTTLTRWFERVKQLNTAQLISGEIKTNDHKTRNRIGVFPKLAERQHMAHAIEVRLPFLDVRLVEKIQKIPGHYRKDIVATALGVGVSRSSKYRRLQDGDFPPLEHKLMSDALLNGLIDNYLSRDAIKEAGIFDYDRVQELLRGLSSRFHVRQNKQKISRQVILIITTQILDFLFVRRFHENLVGRSTPYIVQGMQKSSTPSGNHVSVA
jgi:asparagine synthase (glutamine-hydrolysing)